MRFRILFFVLMLCLGCFIAGCEGDVHHDVSTGEDGALDGLVLTPTPQTLDVSSGENFYLDWKRGYTPPATFHVTLETIDNTGYRDGIYTELKTSSVGHYILEPTGSLASEKFLLLTVTGNGETVRAMYLTEEGSYLLNTKAKAGGSIEHTVTTTPDKP
ncbi:MAG TPA: hypothetical protein VHV83_11740 [Armatimonadota bacterium]|nr:hypothetical protein [Armatimonadota bacterium]